MTLTDIHRRVTNQPPTALTHVRTLPGWAPWTVLAGSVAAGFLLTGGHPVSTGLLAGLFYLAGIYLLSRVTENRRKATDRLMTGLVTGAFVLATAPLASLVWTVLDGGLPVLSGEFFHSSMRNVIGEGGGIYHAMWGTLIVTGLATAISVPIGVLAGVYLVEYGTGRLARLVTLLVDVMTGIPSIVAGLFAYALFVIFFGPGVRMGLGGAVALAVLMIPVVVRSTEEMLKLVPDDLREASYALGVPQWRTITKVVLPTAMAGIATGIMLAIARVIGETAPLLVIAGKTDSTNLNPFDGHMMTLPVFTFYQYSEPGTPPEFSIDRAMGSAVVLILIVLVLNLLARIISSRFSTTTKG